MADTMLTCCNSAFAERFGIKASSGDLGSVYVLHFKVELEVAYEPSSRLHYQIVLFFYLGTNVPRHSAGYVHGIWYAFNSTRAMPHVISN